MNYSVEDILKLSKKAAVNLIYTKEQLEEMPQEQLNVIYAGMQDIGKHRC